jgi:hypothetical protein
MTEQQRRPVEILVPPLSIKAERGGDGQLVVVRRKRQKEGKRWTILSANRPAKGCRKQAAADGMDGAEGNEYNDGRVTLVA